MPLDRFETAAVHQAAKAAAAGAEVRWRIRPFARILWWYEVGKHPVKVTSAQYGAAFWRLAEEAAQVYAMELERLRGKTA